MSTHSYASSPHMASVKKSPSHEGYSSESESKMQSSLPGAKRRASRAGTRSVTTLTAAQLERKRANDREAQRAIRQRTKDHIESLERQIAELTAQQDTSNHSKLMELMQRNEELEQENTVLKTRLNHAAAAFGCADSGGGALVSDFSSSPVRRLRAYWLHVARKPTAAFPFSTLQSPFLFPQISSLSRFERQDHSHGIESELMAPRAALIILLLLQAAFWVAATVAC